MKFHEFANLFPMMADADLKELADDIKANGLRDLIVTLDGKILDGRNRHRACELAGVAPSYVQYEGKDALSFVISHNLHRRHLTESQRGMVAAKLANLQYGQRPSIDGGGVSQVGAGSMLNVGESTVTRAKKIQRIGSPELVSAVESGEVTVGAAYKVAELPHDEQRELVNAGGEAVKAKAKEFREASKEEPEPLVVDESRPQRRSPMKVVESAGMDKWEYAKSYLDQINKNDEFREKALKACIAYCRERLAKNK